MPNGNILQSLFCSIAKRRLGSFLLKTTVNFHTCSVSGSTKEDDGHFTVVIDSFIGKLLKVKVRVTSWKNFVWKNVFRKYHRRVPSR